VKPTELLAIFDPAWGLPSKKPDTGVSVVSCFCHSDTHHYISVIPTTSTLRLLTYHSLLHISIFAAIQTCARLRGCQIEPAPFPGQQKRWLSQAFVIYGCLS